MGTVSIQNHIDNPKALQIFCWQRIFKININDSVREALNPQEELTTDKALKILRNIEIRSKVQSFFTKPAVIISLGAVVCVGAFIAAVALVATVAASLFVVIASKSIFFTGILFLGAALSLGCNDAFQNISNQYADRATWARHYIDRINEARAEGREVKIELAPANNDEYVAIWKD